MSEEGEDVLNDLNGNNVVFKEEDILFLGANIFGHDFFHDFNVVKFQARLSKIQEDIARLKLTNLADKVIDVKTLINDEKGGGNSKESSEETSETFAEKTFKTNGDETETYQDYKAFVKDTEVKDIEERYSVLGGEYTEFYLNLDRRMTRSLLKEVDKILTFISETKLFVLGYVCNIDSSGSLKQKGGKEEYKRPFSLTKVRNPFRSIEEQPKKIRKFTNPEPRASTNLTEGMTLNHLESLNHERKKQSIIHGFKSTYAEIPTNDSSYTSLKNYFNIMYKLFLLCQTENICPFDVFHNIILEAALFKIIFFHPTLDDVTNDVLVEILETLIEQGNRRNEIGGTFTKQVGGESLEEKINDCLIKVEDNRLLFLQKMDNTTFTDDIITNYVEKILPSDIQDLETLQTENENKKNTTSDKVLSKLFKQIFMKVYPLLSMLQTAHNKYRNAIERNVRNVQIEIQRNHLFTVLSNIYAIIHENLLNYCKKIENLNKVKSIGELTAENVGSVQKVCKTVAYGVLTYILKVNPEEIQHDYTSSILQDQINIIGNVYRGMKQSELPKIDNALVAACYKYLQKLNNEKISVYTYSNTNRRTVIQNAIQTLDSKSKVVINNAVKPDTLNDILITTGSKIICPISSRADAMGNFGSCNYNNIPREYHNMDFALVNSDQTMGYIGKTFYNATNKLLSIQYYAKFHDFILPYTEIKMKLDVNVGALSANTTFKVIINKIISLWKKLPTENNQEDQYWEALKSSSIFTDLVAVGSNKSVGDLFQEVTSVTKNGGYQDKIIDEKQARIGAMGDGPSGVRAAFMIANAELSGIHQKTLAGYFSNSNGLFVSYVDRNDSKQEAAKSNQKGKKGKKGGNKSKKYQTRNSKFQTRKKRSSIYRTLLTPISGPRQFPR